MTVRILQGDARAMLRTLEPKSVNCCVTSPPYFGLRAYGTNPQVWGGNEHEHEWAAAARFSESSLRATGRAGLGDQSRERWIRSDTCDCGAWRGELGAEPTPEMFVAHLVDVFREVKRVLRPDGVIFVNIGDSYAGSGNGSSDYRESGAVRSLSLSADKYQGQKPGTPTGYKAKDLIGVPWMLAFALRADGWYLRSEITWAKRACMPESVRDRPTNATEKVFLLSRSKTYWYDADAVREPDAGSDHPRHVLSRPEPSGGVLPPHTGIRKAEGRSGAGANMRNWWLLGPEPFREWGQTVRQIPVSLDAIDGDTKRTTSPACPLHGSQDHPRPSDPGDERADVSAERLRSPGSDSDHASTRTGEPAPIALSPVEDLLDGNSDSLRQSHFDAAIPRSNETHRTDPGLATSQPYTPSAGTAVRTGDKSRSRAVADWAERSDGNSTGLVCSGGLPSARTGPGIVRTPSCGCSYYKEVTESISHFATFPTEVPRRAILAGCPEGGTVLDPFAGSGTTLMVADRLNRNAVGIELNPAYVEIAERRIRGDNPLFTDLEVA